MADVTMPRLSDSMEEGTVLKWLKSDGDEVAKGEELVEIETDKATMTYEADSDGVLEIVAGEGDTLPIGEVIARLGDGSGAGPPAAEEDSAGHEESQAQDAGDEAGDEGAGDEEARDGERAGGEEGGDEESAEGDESTGGEESAPAQPAPATSGNGGDPAGEAAPAATMPGGDGGDGERVKASPVAKRMARELSVDLQGVSGSGPGGRIVKADVEAAAGDGAAPEKAPADEAPATEAPQPAGDRASAPAAGAADGATAKGETTVQELSRTQQLIARRMAESRATVPDFNLVMDIDMEEAVALRSQLKGAAGEGQVVPSLNDFVVKACALALREFPRVNGSYKDGRFELHGRVNVGVAVAGEDALVVPTVFDADTKSLGQIARDGRALAQRVREKQITPPELSGGTFTVSNLGMFGIDRFTAVINPPQAAILAVGSVSPRVVVREEEILSRQVMTVTLACDHRILYGADAAQFLGRVRDLLQQPLALAL
jgi:pyruvate dehydrogenase E2 component (dihydrolipoamide acetyltransferase)